MDPGPVGAAAKLDVDTMTAPKRVAALKKLAGADCRYWPEAEDALAGALRGDRSEDVRYAAAVALQSGCCCTQKTILALDAAVSGLERDGFPAERSVRVRTAACVALNKCLRCAACSETDGPADEPLNPDDPNAPKKDPEGPKGEGEGSARRRLPPPTAAQVARAQRTADAFQQLLAAAPPPAVAEPPSQAPVLVPPPAPQPSPAAVLVPAAPVAQTAYARVAPPAPVVADQLARLKHSPHVEERFTAVRTVCRLDWKQHLEIPATLLMVATADPVAAVRVDCVRHLAAFKMAAPGVATGLAAIAARDGDDVWVRSEAHKAAVAVTPAAGR
jgi:hypothetical protein